MQNLNLDCSSKCSCADCFNVWRNCDVIFLQTINKRSTAIESIGWNNCECRICAECQNNSIFASIEHFFTDWFNSVWQSDFFKTWANIEWSNSDCLNILKVDCQKLFQTIELIISNCSNRSWNNYFNNSIVCSVIQIFCWICAWSVCNIIAWTNITKPKCSFQTVKWVWTNRSKSNSKPIVNWTIIVNIFNVWAVYKCICSKVCQCWIKLNRFKLFKFAKSIFWNFSDFRVNLESNNFIVWNIAVAIVEIAKILSAIEKIFRIIAWANICYPECCVSVCCKHWVCIVSFNWKSNPCIHWTIEVNIFYCNTICKRIALDCNCLIVKHSFFKTNASFEWTRTNSLNISWELNACQLVIIYKCLTSNHCHINKCAIIEPCVRSD